MKKGSLGILQILPTAISDSFLAEKRTNSQLVYVVPHEDFYLAGRDVSTSRRLQKPEPFRGLPC